MRTSIKSISSKSKINIRKKEDKFIIIQALFLE